MSDNSVQPFTSKSITLVADTKKLSAKLAPNTAQVWPGGTVFNTIQAAMDSISGASPQEQYQVAVGTGTFEENVVMKDYVYIVGAGQGQTIITAGAQNSVTGVVNSCSGGGISEVTINAPGAGWGAWPTGIKIVGSGNYHISGVSINVGMSGVGNNVVGISNNTGSYLGNLIIGSCVIIASGDQDSTVVGMDLFGTGSTPTINAFINLTAIQATGGGQNIGIITAIGSTITAEDSKVIANTWALYMSDGTGLITANQCTIDGPVSAGVVINN